MPPLHRPSARELAKKLKEAEAAFEASSRRVFPSDTTGKHHVLPDMEELKIDSVGAHWQLVYECIQIAQDDPLSAHRHIPEKSNKDDLTKGLAM